jgi:hypothetical protein
MRALLVAAFLVRHSNAYTYAITASFVEHGVETLIFPSLKTGLPITVTRAIAVQSLPPVCRFVCCAASRNRNRGGWPVHPAVGVYLSQAQFYARDPKHEAQFA